METILFALIAAFFWGAAPVFEKIGLKEIDPIIGVAIRSFVVTLIMVIYLASRGRIWEFSRLSYSSIAYIAMGAIFASLLGQFFYYQGLKYGEATKIVPVASVYPLIALMLAILMLGEKLTLNRLVGTILIIAGVALIK